MGCTKARKTVPQPTNLTKWSSGGFVRNVFTFTSYTRKSENHSRKGKNC